MAASPRGGRWGIFWGVCVCVCVLGVTKGDVGVTQGGALVLPRGCRATPRGGRWCYPR